MNRRIVSIEDQKEDLDLETLLDKGTFSAEEIIGMIKNLQAEILRKTVSYNDMNLLREDLVDMQQKQDKMLERTV